MKYHDQADLLDDLWPPEWYSTVKAAEKMHTQPWVIDDDPSITPYEWSQRVLVAASCEAEVQEWSRRRNDRKNLRR